MSASKAKAQHAPTRTIAKRLLACTLALALLTAGALLAAQESEEGGASQGPLARGIYGGWPKAALEAADAEAAWALEVVVLSERQVEADTLAKLSKAGIEVHLEFNSLHDEATLEAMPDARALQLDGSLDAPNGWLGACPSHEGYREARLEALRGFLAQGAIATVWLDYHHAPADWERPQPVFGTGCACPRCVAAFEQASGLSLGDTVEARAAALDGGQRSAWQSWRAELLAAWLDDYRSVLNEASPATTLGLFVPPWTASEHDAALVERLGLDPSLLAPKIDRLSPMLYPVRYATDGADWIREREAPLRQTWGERVELWPIVQVSDWGGAVSLDDVDTFVRAAAWPSARGVLAFKWGSFRKDREKVEALRQVFRELEVTSP